MKIKTTVLLLSILFLLGISSFAQNKELPEQFDKLIGNDENLNHPIDRLEKLIDDVLWYEKVGNIAHVDKLYMHGPQKRKEENRTGKGAGIPVSNLIARMGYRPI